MRKVIFLFIITLFLPMTIFARSKTSCDYTLLSNLKSLASNIDISYKYNIYGDNVTFDITLTNIQNDIYFIDYNNNRTYYYSDTYNGRITISGNNSGKVTYIFYSNSPECLNEKLNVRYVNLPYYNKYYSYDECQGIEEYSLCHKWINNIYEYNDFKKETDNYRQKKFQNKNEDVINQKLNWFDIIVNLYINYAYLIIPTLLGIIIGIMYLVKYIKFKLNRFNI